MDDRARPDASDHEGYKYDESFGFVDTGCFLFKALPSLLTTGPRHLEHQKTSSQPLKRHDLLKIDHCLCPWVMDEPNIAGKTGSPTTLLPAIGVSDRSGRASTTDLPQIRNDPIALKGLAIKDVVDLYDSITRELATPLIFRRPLRPTAAQPCSWSCRSVCVRCWPGGVNAPCAFDH
jgi:hypothetical protein